MLFNEIFRVSPEEHREICNFYEKTQDEIKVMVKKLKKWIKTQTHLPCDQDDYFFEMMLKLNKFNEEKTRKKIDMYYTIRDIVPEFYENRSPLKDEMKIFMNTLMVLPLPHLTSSLERVYLVRFLDTDPNNFDLITNAKYLFTLFDVRLRHDPAVGERYIYDLTGLRIGHVWKVNPLTVKKIYTIMEKAYSDKIKGIHFLNMPMIGNVLINIAKLVMSEKLAKRIHSHKSLESLNEIIPRKLLPSDYEGDEKSSLELYGKWKTALENSSAWLEDISLNGSNNISEKSASNDHLEIFNI